MTEPLKVELEKRMPWLFQDLGFRVIYHDYSYKDFGNSVAVLKSDVLLVRFVRDRSRIEVEVASLSEPERWMELGFLWYAITGYRPEPELEGWAWFFRDHLAELEDALGPGFSQTKQQFDRRQEESREILRRHMPRVTPVGRLRRFKATPLGAMLMGPLGWIVAVSLVAFKFLSQ
jgi:hypothetical protein